MEAASTSETSVNFYKTTQRNIAGNNRFYFREIQLWCFSPFSIIQMTQPSSKVCISSTLIQATWITHRSLYFPILIILSDLYKSRKFLVAWWPKLFACFIPGWIQIFAWAICFQTRIIYLLTSVETVTLVHWYCSDAERQEGKHGELEPHVALSVTTAAHTVWPAMERAAHHGLLMYALAACRKGHSCDKSISGAAFGYRRAPIYEVLNIQEYFTFTLSDSPYFIRSHKTYRLAK
jgi:hypothetical protein